MTDGTPTLLVTAATGQLGRLVIDELLKTTDPARLIAGARDTAAAADLAARGVRVRAADYDKPDTLDAALAGVDRVLLISSNLVDGRVAQHRNVIEAAKRAGVNLLAYTSMLRADTSPEMLAESHRQTEGLVRESGVPFALLRNGWYNENDLMGAAAALEHGALVGSSGAGRISAAARADYAAAAAAVLAARAVAPGAVYELAGDTAYTKADLAAELSRQSGKPVAYKNLTEAELEQVFVGAGLPEDLAAALADADAGAADGDLFDDSHTLSRLIGRPTTPLAESVRAALAG